MQVLKVTTYLFYGVPLRSKYPDSEMLFQKKQKVSRDVQNMMPKIITYRSRAKKNVNRVPVYLMK